MEKEKRIRNYGKVKKQIEAFFVALRDDWICSKRRK